MTSEEIWEVLESEFKISSDVKQALFPYIKDKDGFKMVLHGMLLATWLHRENPGLSFDMMLDKIEAMIAKRKEIQRRHGLVAEH